MGIQLFNENDKLSRLLNIDKRAWLKKSIENKASACVENRVDTESTLKYYKKLISGFESSHNSIKTATESDTALYFIEPVIKKMFSEYGIGTRENMLPETGARLDAVLYDKSKYYKDGSKKDNNTGFVFVEYKRAGIYVGSKVKDEIYDVAASHSLVCKQSGKNGDKDKMVLKGSLRKQMIDYLVTTRVIDGGNSSLGIITNGLSYYIVMDSSDNKSANKTWSILYSLDIAELACEYEEGNESIINKADRELNTFKYIVEQFMELSLRKEFISWYNSQYKKAYDKVEELTDDRADYEKYKTEFKLSIDSNYRLYMNIMR